MTNLRFGGKVVTGAAGGLGAAVARKLDEEGATVVTTDREAFTSERFVTVACDVADDAEIRRLSIPAGSGSARVDLLFNNAGISGAPARRVHEYELETWDRVLGVNLRGAFLVLRHALTGQTHVIDGGRSEG